MVVYYVRREEGADMLTMTREPDAPVESLLKDFLALDAQTPEGYRAELLDGAITVTPPPDGNHEDNIAEIMEQILAKSHVPMRCSGYKGLIVSSHGTADEGRVIPDLTCAPRELKLFRNAPPWMEVAGVAMVVEVTSSQPNRDREAKRHAYASARIPLYLLADRQKHTVTLFTQPTRDDYVGRFVVPLGDKLDLPEPFSFALDTSGFEG
jgi:Uma2 family endonuclease